MNNKCSICNRDNKSPYEPKDCNKLIYNKPGLFSGKESFFICYECGKYIKEKYEKPRLYYDKIFIKVSSYYEIESINTEDFEFLNSIKNEVSKLMNEPKPCENCGIEHNILKKRTCEKCGFKYCEDCGKWHCPECEEKNRQKKEKLKTSIKKLLTEKSIKMTISDITAHIKHNDRDEVKSLLEKMHKDEDIDFAGNGRYFIYSEEKKEPKKAAPKTEEVDVEKELEEYKGLLDKGLITQEQYDAKSNELLGL